MVADQRSTEIRLLLILLAVIAVFTFWVIPASVEDPEGFGYAQGLAPSFSVYVVAAFAAITLLLRLFRVMRDGPQKFQPSAEAAQGEDANTVDDDVNGRRRSWKIIGSCLLFAFILVPYVGFYLSSFAFVVFLAITMGEQRPLVLVILPLLLLVGIYFAFELGFTIALPRGEILPLIFDAGWSS
jgi:hypothetical protein